MDYTNVVNRLKEQAKDEQIKYNNNIIPGAKPSLGVRVPVLRKMAKEFARDDYKSFMKECSEEYYEQEMLKAFAIGYAKDEIGTILEYATGFVPKIHDWAVNDAFCQNFSIARKYRAEVLQWVLRYVESESEFEQRVVAVLLMSHFLNDDYVDIVLDTMNRLKHEGYYTKMGVAWCVATAYAKYPEKTMLFLNNNNLDDWTYNKAIQKMTESYRVTDDHKKILRQMKRK